jgi:AraC-like DNA-binding protein
VVAGAVVLVHVAQAVRMATAPSPAFHHVVPIALSLEAMVAVVLLVVYPRRWPLARPRVATCPPETVRQAILERRLHLDPDLRLSDVAAALGTPPAAVSKAVNAREGMSFRVYVNRLRVAEARALLRAEREAHTSVEAIGLLCGFKSRSAFYTAFKREMGVTPAAYRAAHRCPETELRT